MNVIMQYSPKDTYANESWWVIKNESEDRFAKDVVSPWNDDVEALLAVKFYPVDNAILTLYHAKSSQKKDDVNGDNYKGWYFVILSNVEETERYNSYRMYRWDDAIQIMNSLKDLSFKAALRIWKLKKY